MRLQLTQQFFLLHNFIKFSQQYGALMNIKAEHPRVLIVSHNALSDCQSNGKTLAAFFSQWNKDKLAQLYLTSDVPDFTHCNNFYQIHDVDILKRLTNKTKYQGRIVDFSYKRIAENYKLTISSSLILKILRQNISPFFRFMRDILWFFSGYKTNLVIKFINDFNPEIVFFQSSNGEYAYSIVKWICTTRKIPLVMQTTDDYVTGKKTLDPFFWIHLYRLKKAYQWAVNYSDCIVSIGDKMAVEYHKRFGGKYIVAMNSIDKPDIAPYTATNKVVQLVYAGNLGLNRWKILSLIAQCLVELKEESDINAELSIYSLIKPNKHELRALSNPPYSTYKGSVDTEGLNRIKAKSDLLVHVEAFDNNNRHITRLSISTKIPEYLASGRCVFAVGPPDVASIQYLVDNDLGVVVTNNDKSVIKAKIKEIITNVDTRVLYANKGIKIALEKHNIVRTVEAIQHIIVNAVKNYKYKDNQVNE